MNKPDSKPQECSVTLCEGGIFECMKSELQEQLSEATQRELHLRQDWLDARKEKDELMQEALALREALSHLKHLNNHTIDEELWRIDIAIDRFDEKYGEKK